MIIMAHEDRIRELIARGFSRGSKGLTRCKGFVVYKHDSVREVKTAHGRFDIIAFDQKANEFHLIETKDIHESNKRLVSFGQVFGQAIAYKKAIELDRDGFVNKFCEGLDSYYLRIFNKCLTVTKASKPLKIWIYVGINGLGNRNREFLLEQLHSEFKKIGIILVGDNNLRIIQPAKPNTIRKPNRLGNIERYFEKGTVHHRLAKDLVERILGLNAVKDSTRQKEYVFSVKRAFVWIVPRKGSICVYYKRKRKNRGHTSINSHEDVEKVMMDIRKAHKLALL